MGTKETLDKAFKRSSVWGFRRSSTLHVSGFTFHVLRFALFGLLVSVLSGNFAYSQDITVSADVTPKIISLNETATLRVTVSANQQLGNIAPPKLKALPEFNVSYGGSSSQYNLTGNQISVSVTWTYVLRPKKVGQFMVSSIQTSHGNKTTQRIQSPSRCYRNLRNLPKANRRRMLLRTHFPAARIKLKPLSIIRALM